MNAPTAQQQWLTSLGGADAFTDWVFHQVSSHVHGNVLEVGCGTGTFTRLLATRARHIYALDLEPAFVDEARQRTADLVNVEVAEADATTFRSEDSFDTVVMLDVLEHIDNDLELLTALGRRLLPGGRIILKVPAIPALLNSLDHAVGHHRRYSRKSLTSVLDRAGFKVERVAGFNLLGVLGWWWNGSVLKRSVPPGDQVKGFDRVVPILRTVESLLPPPTGLSLIAVGRRLT